MNAENPFRIPTGSDRLRNPFLIGSVLVMTIGMGAVVAKGGFTVATALMVLPFLVYALNRLIFKPEYGLTFAFIINFLLVGLMRYIPVKLGYVMDITLVVIYIAMFFHYFETKLSLKPVKTDLVVLSAIWFIYICLEFFNPEAISKAAWFGGMRGIGLYMMLVVPLVILLYNEPKHLERFFMIWGVFSILASVKAWMQLNIGPDPWEQRWLDEIGGITHIIWGQLRAFSFYSDAGQFGAAQGQIGIIATVLMLNEKNARKRFFWGAVMVAGYYGMFVSGTRGAITVPFAGGVMYLILKNNIKVVILGAIILAITYSFFRFTTLGNSNYQIYRMRTAFVPEEDASYQVRLSNQRIFEQYLKTRPFGGGIGHAGDRAKQYTPNAFLATIATDSWFVLIWAECGIVGLYLHLFVLGYIIGKGAYICMFQLKTKEMVTKMSALLCGIVGVVVASYGNAVLGQFPTGLLVYASMAYVFMAPMLEQKRVRELALAEPVKTEQ
jgi:hypothetical protein